MSAMSNKKLLKEKARTPLHLNKPEKVLNSTMRARTPNLPRKSNMNETIAFRPGSSQEPNFKSKPATNFGINYESECDSVYNDYLQALMIQQIVELKIEEQTQMLEDQLLVQEENLCKRQTTLKELVGDMENYKTKTEIISIIDFLQEHFINFIKICSNYDTKTQLDQLKNILNLECDNVVLRNIKVLKNQEEYDTFFDALEACVVVTQKIVNSGRDFQEVHSFADRIRKLHDLITIIEKSRQGVSDMEKEAMYKLLEYMSDYFANKYLQSS